MSFGAYWGTGSKFYVAFYIELWVEMKIDVIYFSILFESVLKMWKEFEG